MKSLICTLTVLVTSSVFAQELPNPKPTEAHKMLAQDVGTWDCEVKMFLQGPTGPASESKGVEVNKPVSGDLHLQTSFNCMIGDRKFEGHGLTSYNPTTKKYEGTWVDNFTMSQSRFEGEFDEDANSYIVHMDVSDDSGNTVKQKHVTTWTDDSNKRFEIFMLIEAGGETQEVKIMDMTAKKREKE